MDDLLIDKEIQKASNAIDKALSTITKENRGEVCVRILSVIRNLNDHVAFKIWKDIHPEKEAKIKNVATNFSSIANYRFIGIFDKYLQKSVSHFTPSEDGAERLMIKYYKYLLLLKKTMYDRYDFNIIDNIEMFLEDIDEQTKEYYEEISKAVDQVIDNKYKTQFDNYYIDKIKPFYVNNNIYYEVVLEPASEKMNKFNRVTAFTKCDITTNYCVALSLTENTVNVFSVEFPIKIITDWNVSIRPCEINNYAKILRIKSTVQRSYNEYKSLMLYLKENEKSLVDVIDSNYDEFEKTICFISQNTNSMTIQNILKCSREISTNNKSGKNPIRYLLNRMRNRIILDFMPSDDEKQYNDLYLSTKCYPFDQHPFSFNPKKHETNIYELLECISTEGRLSEILARFVANNAVQNGCLYTSIEELSHIGDKETIEHLVKEYNESLYEGFKPDSELEVYKNKIYLKGNEIKTLEILEQLKFFSSKSNNYGKNFTDENISKLQIDDENKKEILLNMFHETSVHVIYGAAGTGKTTLVNFVYQLLGETCAVFLTKTNSAKENLRSKIENKKITCDFLTIDSFLSNKKYFSRPYELFVVDECSTVKNEEILAILKRAEDGIVLLIGDTYQIEAIGFGNWFGMCQNYLSSACCHHLTTPYRTNNKYLVELWNQIRLMKENNQNLEHMVRHDYSHIIDNDIFKRKSMDEIILCLNYNGLYGLNNINRLLQLGNPGKSVTIGVWEFRVGDPILFNDSGRFEILYNNLKGRIIDIVDDLYSVHFTVEVETLLTENDVKYVSGLTYISNDNQNTIVDFWVDRVKPYASDEESNSLNHILPFQIAYAVSIHKSQGLEYASVKIVIADEVEEQITHNIFYTAITRAKESLTIYWSPEVCNRVLNRIKPTNYLDDYYLLKYKYNL